MAEEGKHKRDELKVLLSEIVARKPERELMEDFLLSKGLEGQSYFAQIKERASLKVREIDRSVILANRGAVSALKLESLKSQTTAVGLSAYQDLLLAVSERYLSGRDRDYIRRARSTGITVNMPRVVDAFKKAEREVKEKSLEEVTERECIDYQQRVEIKKQLQALSKDLFFAVNIGLEPRLVPNFCAVMYELGQLKVREPINELSLKNLVAESLKTGKILEMVHVKSLRFTYPEGSRLQILDHTEVARQPMVGGRTRFYPSEEVIFSRLEKMRVCLRAAAVESRLTVIISDFDLDYCFPAGQKLVPPGDVIRARESARRYVDGLKQKLNGVQVYSLGEFLELKGKEARFRAIFDLVVGQCRAGGGPIISARILENRVNEQFDHYQEMFGEYNRTSSRYTASSQIGNVVALSAVFEAFSTMTIFVCDSRGIEDELIGSYDPNGVVKFFMKLKDPVEMC